MQQSLPCRRVPLIHLLLLSEPHVPCRQLPSCLPQAAWWAVQEAAKQLVASRLRTHHGGPAQTLAALERAVQAAASRLAEGGGGDGPVFAGRQQAAVLLLLFVFALEQGISCAAAGGGSSRADASQPAATFFTANEKVGQVESGRMALLNLHKEQSVLCNAALPSPVTLLPKFPLTPWPLLAGVPGVVCSPAPASR